MTEELNGGCLDEREAFEAWVLTQPGGTEYAIRRRDMAGSERLGSYVEPAVEFAWQALCALSTSKQAGAEPVITVYRGGTDAFGRANVVVRWEAGAENLPDGEHKLYATPPAATPAAPGEVEPASQEQARVMANIRKSLDAVYANLKDRDCLGATLAMEGVLKTIDALSHPAPVAAPEPDVMFPNVDGKCNCVLYPNGETKPCKVCDPIAAPAPAFKPGSFLMQKIDAAAEALSEVMAFSNFGAALGLGTKVSRALSGLRGLQSAATPTPGDSADAPVQQAGSVPMARIEKLAADIQRAGGGAERSLSLVSAFLRDCAHAALKGEQPVEPSGTERGNGS